MPPFFEGWYYKLVDARQQHSLAIMPGIVLAEDASESHAFVQFFSAPGKSVAYRRYAIDQFWSARRRFEIVIGPNHFAPDRISLNVETPEHSLRGDLRFRDLTPWPVTLVSPGIMGWYAWVPFMECYQGVVSLDHGIDGGVQLDQQRIGFGGGRGYTEKSWGKSFPEAWIWFQTNHFEQPGISLSASIAVIPWLRSPFAGFIVGLWHAGHLYRFATYTGARVERLEVNDADVRWVVRDRRYRLEMLVTRASGRTLRSPVMSGMAGRVIETLDATVAVGLDDMRPEMPVALFRGVGRHAGLDVGGDTPRFIELLAGRAAVVAAHDEQPSLAAIALQRNGFMTHSPPEA